jgi:molybdenum cofactor cytidylyltransferase
VKVVALVLAAGASSRFGSSKLLAPLAGRPVLQHVLDAVAAAGLDGVVVVLGDEAAAFERAITWRTETCVVNPRPMDGLSSSLRVGLQAVALQADADADAALVVLGDQPHLRADVIRTVIDAASPGGTAAGSPIIRVRYDDDPAPNPVLVRRAAWTLTAGVSGDRGLGPLLALHPELVAEVRASGGNPDIDTPEDLVRLARLP